MAVESYLKGVYAGLLDNLYRQTFVSGLPTGRRRDRSFQVPFVPTQNERAILHGEKEFPTADEAVQYHEYEVYQEPRPIPKPHPLYLERPARWEGE
jgi:hypothetical protein